MANVNKKSEHQSLLSIINHLMQKIYPKTDPKQAMYIRRLLLMAVIAYLLCGGLAYVSYLAGFMEWPAIAGLLIFISLISIVFYILFCTGFNLRMNDPSLTFIQMCAAILVVTYCMYFANESRAILLLIYIIILLFGVLRLDTRDFLYISSLILFTYGIDIVLLYCFRPYGVNFRIECLQWSVLAIVLIIISVIGGHISSLRRNLNSIRSDLEKSMLTVQEMSIRDELTGIYNRRHLMLLLEYEKNRSSRGNVIFTIAMLGIDHFKNINDTYGHLIGDDVLRTVSYVIHDTIRNTDFCGRFGGAEFLFVLVQTDIKEAMMCSERVSANIEQCQFPNLNTGDRITVSLGITEYRIQEDIETMVIRADRALSSAKRAGGNRIACDMM